MAWCARRQHGEACLLGTHGSMVEIGMSCAHTRGSRVLWCWLGALGPASVGASLLAVGAGLLKWAAMVG